MKIAVTSRSFSRHPTLRHELTTRFPNALVTFNDSGASLGGDALLAFLRGHDHAVTALETLDRQVFDHVPELGVIAKYGVGLDMLDLPEMSRRGLRLGWRGGVNRRSVAELVIAFAIATLRLVPQANALIREGQWRQLMGRQLSGRVFGIVGCGHIGKDLAVLLRAFGCTVLVNDILDFPDFYALNGLEAVDLETLLRQSEIVSLHLPAGKGTRGLLSAERLALMRPDAILINTARGGVVDEVALRTLLENGHLAAAAFDVFTVEPPQDGKLLSLPNFLATPHIGGSAEEAVLAMGRAAIDGLIDHEVPRPGSEVWRAAGLDD